MIGSIAVLGWLWAAAASANSVPARYVPAPFAKATLFVDPATHSVRIVGETNVIVAIRQAEYQDLRISPAFFVECRLTPNHGLSRIAVWADSPRRLIPADVVEYHSFDPSYVELDIDMSYLENRTDGRLWKDHAIQIDFFARP